MFAAYIIVTVMAAAANLYAATNDFIRPKWLLGNMSKLRVPESWLPILGVLKGAGALARTAGRHCRAADWDRRGRRSHVVLYRCVDHAPPRA
jgi:hypothetical protein